MKKTMKQQMTLEEYKKQAEDFLKERYPNIIKERSSLLIGIKEDSEEYWENN